MADQAAQFENGKVYVLTGETLKKLAKKGDVDGVRGQIAITERAGKFFIGFANEETLLMNKNGVIEEYLIPARPNPDQA